MDQTADAVRQQVFEAAGRLHRATEGMERLFRRREFVRELRERGTWLVDGKPPVEQPEWVQRWSKYWDELTANPEYQRLQGEARRAREALHTPQFEAALEMLQLGDPSGAEYAIAYLEADPWYFRSGYLKARITRWLRQVKLDEPQQERLRQVIVEGIQRGSRYEQVEYRKLGRRLDTEAFRAELRKLAGSKDAGTARRASLALKACELNDTPGRDLRGAR
jgi:hypothetical protein